tara:strand:+ start:1290 stop:1595 length:306 start_codon:yes stop_codon:yes gene_type:complete
VGKTIGEDMFDKINKLFKRKEDKDALSEKEKATAKNEPYVKVLNVQMEKDNPGQGYFELDWNKPFVEKLRASGYVGNTEEEIVDAWFTTLCRSVSNEADFA